MQRDIIELFGADALTDQKTLRRAYARLIKVHRPETDPERFSEINRLYQEAKAAITRGESAAPVGETRPETDGPPQPTEQPRHPQAPPEPAPAEPSAVDATLAALWAQADTDPEAALEGTRALIDPHPLDLRPRVAALGLAVRAGLDPRPALDDLLAAPDDSTAAVLLEALPHLPPGALTLDDILGLLPDPRAITLLAHWWRRLPDDAVTQRAEIAVRCLDDPRLPPDLVGRMVVRSASDDVARARPEARQMWREALAGLSGPDDESETIDRLLVVLEDPVTYAVWAHHPTGRALLADLEATHGPARRDDDTDRRDRWWARFAGVPRPIRRLPWGQIWPLVLAYARTPPTRGEAPPRAVVSQWLRTREAMIHSSQWPPLIHLAVGLVPWIIALVGWLAIIAIADAIDSRFSKYVSLFFWGIGCVFLSTLLRERVSRRLVERWLVWPPIVRFMRATGYLPGDLFDAQRRLELTWMGASFENRGPEQWAGVARREEPS